MSKHILVCGGGSIARRHIKNLLQLGVTVTVWRSRNHLLADLAEEFPINTCDNLLSIFNDVDGVVIATSTDTHISIALQALKAKRAIFIEKPISHNWINVDKLFDLGKNIVIEVGFQFRSHPNLTVLKKKLEKFNTLDLLSYRFAMGYRLDLWRPGQDYKQSYSADSSRGGGALFDLIHQIDIALWFFGPVVEINAVLSKRSSLKIDADDIANLILTHACGITGSIQLDMLSPINRCEIEIITNNSIINWNNTEGKLFETNPLHDKVLINQVPQLFERNDLFLSHMKHWINRLDNSNLISRCSLESGAEALKVAIAARDSSNLKQTLKI